VLDSQTPRGTSHALAETWERRDGRVLTVEGYTQTGGIRAAVAQSAERLYDSLPRPSSSARTGKNHSFRISSGR